MAFRQSRAHRYFFFFFFLVMLFLRSFFLSSFFFLSSTYPRRNQWDSIEISLSKRSTDLFPIIGNLLVRTWNVVGSFEFVRRVFSPLTVIDSSTVKWSAPFRRKRTSRSKKKTHRIETKAKEIDFRDTLYLYFLTTDRTVMNE